MHRLFRSSFIAACCLACDNTTAPDGNAGPEGGRLELADGAVVLDIPAGALDETVEITAQFSSDFPSSSRLVPGTTFDLQPDGLEFALPVTLTIQFDPASLPEGILSPELELHRVVSNAWERLNESSVNESDNVVAAPIQRFSVYGVLGVPVASIAVSPQDAQLMPEETAQLMATPLDANENELPERAVSWASENDGTATVDQTGLVTAVAAGTTTVTATSEGIEATAAITVAEANAGPEGGQLVLADGAVTLDIPAGALDESVLITAAPAPGAPTAPTLVDGTAHDIRPDGLTFNTPVTLSMAYAEENVPQGVRISELRLYRATEGVWNEIEGSEPAAGSDAVLGPINGFSIFAVLGVPVATLEVSTTAVDLEISESIDVNAIARDAEDNDLPDRIVTWESDDTNVATVNEDGLITAEGEGTAVVTASSEGIEATIDVSVSDPTTSPTVMIVASGLSRPVHVTAPPNDMERLFIVEQRGVIRVLEDGTIGNTPFLSIQDAVGDDGSEQGLLSLAFHPDYASNGLFFVYYTNTQGDTRVVRYSVSADPGVATPTSGDTILTLDQPATNHNGGLLAFGPDGYLYIGLGDGGGTGDPGGNGQDSTSLLGSLLRIDVNGAAPYEIPDDNPLIGVEDARAEIWAYGLRNPWRYSFDRMTGDLYVADVGQFIYEEINVQPASSEGGANYGWNIMEGFHCYDAPSCNMTGLTQPIYEYNHSDGNCSVTGGFVYRGAALPDLQGTYFYADYCAGIVRSFRYENGEDVDHRTWSAEFGGSLGNVTSFGEDAAGELYITATNGNVYKIVPE